VFGWEKDRVIVHRISEKGVCIPRMNLLIIHKDETTHCSYMNRITAFLYDQTSMMEECISVNIVCIDDVTTPKRIYLKDTSPNAKGC